MLPRLDIRSTSTTAKIAEAVEHGFSVRLANLLSPDVAAKLLPALMGAGVAIPATAALMHHLNRKKMDHAKNRSFGAGMAAGIAAPKVVRTINDVLNPPTGVM